MGRLDVLVDEPTLVELRDGPGKTETDAQERSHRHGLAEKPFKEFAAWVLKQQNGAALSLHQLYRPRRPSGLQRVFELIFMAQAVKTVWCRRIGAGNNGEHAHGSALTAAPPPADSDIAVLKQGFEIAIAGGG
jgi:hypothetical protein